MSPRLAANPQAAFLNGSGHAGDVSRPAMTPLKTTVFCSSATRQHELGQSIKDATARCETGLETECVEPTPLSPPRYGRRVTLPGNSDFLLSPISWQIIVRGL
jgi:hypothetical protein